MCHVVHDGWRLATSGETALFQQLHDLLVVVKQGALQLVVRNGAIVAQGLQGSCGNAQHFQYLVGAEEFFLFGGLGWQTGMLAEDAANVLQEFGFESLQIVGC